MEKHNESRQPVNAVDRGIYSISRVSIILAVILNLSAYTGNANAQNVGEVKLAPGKSESCFASPCTVSFVMPEGAGTYEVVQDDPNGTKLGDFPAGETVNLGNFYSSTVFFVKGGDFKPAHVWIGGF
jgi:hypothetical protein